MEKINEQYRVYFNEKHKQSKIIKIIDYTHDKSEIQHNIAIMIRSDDGMIDPSKTYKYEGKVIIEKEVEVWNEEKDKFEQSLVNAFHEFEGEIWTTPTSFAISIHSYDITDTKLQSKFAQMIDADIDTVSQNDAYYYHGQVWIEQEIPDKIAVIVNSADGIIDGNTVYNHCQKVKFEKKDYEPISNESILCIRDEIEATTEAETSISKWNISLPKIMIKMRNKNSGLKHEADSFVYYIYFDDTDLFNEFLLREKLHNDEWFAEAEYQNENEKFIDLLRHFWYKCNCYFIEDDLLQIKSLK
jgi:hypothetical protein